MKTNRDKSLWRFMLFGLPIFVSTWLLFDFFFHRAKWASGHATHRFYVVLPTALACGLFFELTTYLIKRFEQRRRSEA